MSSEIMTTKHTFALPALAQHFENTPNPPGADKLIDLPKNEFLETEDEINVVAGSLWLLCVKYDKLGEERWAKDKDDLIKWILKNRMASIESLTKKIDPPLHAFTVNQIERDILAMAGELLVKTLPVQAKVVDAKDTVKDKETK